MTGSHIIERLEELLLDADVFDDGFDDDVGVGGGCAGVRRRGDLGQSVGHEGLALGWIGREFLLDYAAQTFPDAILEDTAELVYS